MNIEKQKFSKIIDTHFQFLTESRKFGSRIFDNDRSRIIQQVSSQLYFAYLSHTLTYPEFKELRDYLRDTLSCENLLGFKQLSIFDFIPEDACSPEVNEEKDI